MKNVLLIGLVAVTLVVECGAQTVVGGNQSKGMDMNTTYSYGTISTFNFSEKTTKGSTYLYNNWEIGTIEVETGIIKECPFNIDLQNNAIEINTDKGVRVIPMKVVKKLEVKNSTKTSERQSFVNTRKFKGQEASVSGIFEVLFENEVTLLKYYYIYTQEGSYNAALDMGNDEVKYIVKDRYFLFKNDKLVEVVPNKKKFLSSFSESDRGKIESYFKENKTKLKEEEDILALSKFLDEKKIGLSN